MADLAPRPSTDPAPAVSAVAPRAAAPARLPLVFDEVVFETKGQRLIDRLSLGLTVGRVTAMIGPNGAGKSLTLRLMAGLLQPTAGTVRWAGARTLPRPGIAMVFQRPVVLRRSVRGNLDHALRLYGVARAERPAVLARWLAQAQLTDLADRPARVLSGGEQQRLAMARALAAAPRLLLLDEPTASLDPHATAAIEGLIRHAVEHGVTVVLVTHDHAQARRLADRAVFLHRGRLVEDAGAADFFAGPRTLEARRFLAGDLLL